MTGIVERLVNLLGTAIVTLNVLCTLGATVENMLMGEGHENRCPHLD
jgi:hypothetical protein